MPEKKNLYRSRTDRKIAGVCGGLGEYFDIDPTLIRLALVFFTLGGGGGLLLYGIAWFIVPEEPVAATEPHLLTDDAPTTPRQNTAPEAETKEAQADAPDA